MKENIILFIIIGLFLLTFIFNYKEGLESTSFTTSKTASNTAKTAANKALLDSQRMAAAKTLSEKEVSSTNSDAFISAKKTYQDSLDSSKTAVTAAITALNKAVTDTLSEKTLTDSAAKVANAPPSAVAAAKVAADNNTEINALLVSVNSLNAALNKNPMVESEVTTALNSFPSAASTVTSPAPFDPKECNGTGTETKVGCQWNKNPNDTTSWWTEHRLHSDPETNKVQWNYHSLDLGDYMMYPSVYRDPKSTTNGLVNFENYTADREKETNELRKKMSNYDISFSAFQSILKNDAQMIQSINAEKERLKRDISDNYEEVPYDYATCPSLKCIADFGTNIGDNLCCGQTGVLQNTEYVCPSSKPTCQNFKCGSKFGTCT